MNSLVRILAATDLSPPARRAVDRGFWVAECTGARYEVLHALDLSLLDHLDAILGDGRDAVKSRLTDSARETLRELLADPVRHRGVAAEARVVVGDALASIAERADAIDASLLVLGARGDSFLRHAALGSTASRLMRLSVRRPVLVVKEAPHEPYRRALVAVDFSPASLEALRLVRAVAPGATLIIVHAFELPYEGQLVHAGVDAELIEHYIGTEQMVRRRQIEELASAAGLADGDYLAIVSHGDPAQQVVAVEQDADCDLIVVGKHGTHLAEELLLGSVTKHVLAESQADVLVVCDPHRG